jgi:HEAT repeat protein
MSHGLIPSVLSWVGGFGQTNANFVASGYASPRMRRRLLGGFLAGLRLFVLVWASLFVRTAWAAVEAAAPPGAGTGALAVKVDLPGWRVFYEDCVQQPCAVTVQSKSVPISADKVSLPDPADVITEVVPIGGGRIIVHVRVPLQPAGLPLTPAWEGVFAAGAPQPLFKDVTGWRSGEPGERAGVALLFVDQNGTKAVAKGDIQEDLRICGDDSTLLHPQVLEPQTLIWRGASVQQLSPVRVGKAVRVVASLRGGASADPPLAPLLAAEGASSSIGAPKSLSDGDPETTWSEGRSGQGPGEFVRFHAPHEVPLTRFAIAVAPKAPKAVGAAPRTFYLATDTALFQVAMPEDAWMHPGAAYDIALPDPVTTSCVALILGDAYTRGNPKPEVTVAELYAYSAFDAPGATLGSVALVLSGGGPRAEAAAGILKRAGGAGLKAAELAYDQLDAAGRALAVDIAASSSSCAASSSLLVRALSEREEVVREKARAKLEQPHCGRDAVPALVAALDVPDTRVRSATLLAMVAASQALDPIAKVLGQGSPADRARLRSAFAHAAAEASIDALAALLSAGRDPEARVELVRASEARLGDVRDAADRALDELFALPSSLRTRYVLVSPIAALAHAGDPKDDARLVTLLERDSEPLVRARAAELAGASAKTQAALDAAAKDPEPRVREAALRAVGDSRVVAARGGAILALGSDTWTFVRAEAATALAALPSSAAADEALGGAVADKAPRVRVAAIGALAAHAARAYADRVRVRLDDAHEDIDVRVAAAHALGALCDERAVNALSDYAVLGASSPDPNEVALGLAATAALGQLHPADLASRLKKVHAKGARPDALRAADAAAAEPGSCH